MVAAVDELDVVDGGHVLVAVVVAVGPDELVVAGGGVGGAGARAVRVGRVEEADPGLGGCGCGL